MMETCEKEFRQTYLESYYNLSKDLQCYEKLIHSILCCVTREDNDIYGLNLQNNNNHCNNNNNVTVNNNNDNNSHLKQNHNIFADGFNFAMDSNSIIGLPEKILLHSAPSCDLITPPLSPRMMIQQQQQQQPHIHQQQHNHHQTQQQVKTDITAVNCGNNVFSDELALHSFPSIDNILLMGGIDLETQTQGTTAPTAPHRQNALHTTMAQSPQMSPQHQPMYGGYKDIELPSYLNTTCHTFFFCTQNNIIQCFFFMRFCAPQPNKGDPLLFVAFFFAFDLENIFVCMVKRRQKVDHHITSLTHDNTAHVTKHIFWGVCEGREGRFE